MFYKNINFFLENFYNHLFTLAYFIIEKYKFFPLCPCFIKNQFFHIKIRNCSDYKVIIRK